MQPLGQKKSHSLLKKKNEKIPTKTKPTKTNNNQDQPRPTNIKTNQDQQRLTKTKPNQDKPKQRTTKTNQDQYQPRHTKIKTRSSESNGRSNVTDCLDFPDLFRLP